MKNKILTCLAIVGFIFCGSEAFAGTHSAKEHPMDTHASDTHSETKPISKVSAVQNMPDDSVVYIQGYITQSLGDEMYVFQDDSGTVNIEIDDDLMSGNNVSPNTIVWIAAEINKEGNVTALEAEEIQFMPATNSTDNMKTSE